jgi:phytoene dehydrogenase-like protein
MFDVIVIGNDLGSLISAVYSSHHGKKTVLLNDVDIPDFYSCSGYTFDSDPLPWAGFEPHGIFTETLTELNVPVDTIPLTPSLQFIFSGHRFSLFSDPTSQVKELDRAFGIHSAEFRTFYESMVKAGNFVSEIIGNNPRIRPETVTEFLGYLFSLPKIIWRRKIFLRRFKGIQANPLLQKAFFAQLLLFSHLNPEGISPLSFAHTLSTPFRGLYHQIDGKYRLIKSLKEKIESNGGMVKNCHTLTLKIGSDVTVDIATQNNDDCTITGKNVILSTQWKGFLPYILEDNRCSSIADNYTNIETSHYPFTIHIGLSEKIIPEKMCEYSVLIPDDLGDEGNHLLREHCFFVWSSAAGDRGRAPEHKRALSITALLKNSPLNLSNKELKTVSILMIKILEGFLPSLNEYIDFIDIDASIDISRKIQESLNHKYRVQNKPLLGLSLLSNKTPLENLYITGGMLLAGLGIEGEVMSGLNAAKRLHGGENNVRNQ